MTNVQGNRRGYAPLDHGSTALAECLGLLPKCEPVPTRVVHYDAHGHIVSQPLKENDHDGALE